MTPLLLSLLLLLVKSLCVFALAGLTLLALRRASATSRHLVCLLTLAALLALPLFAWTSLSLPISVPLGGPAAVSAGAEPNPPAPFPKKEGGAEPQKIKYGRHLPNPSFLGRGGEGRAGVGSSPAPQNWGGGASFLLALWLLGVLAAAVRPLLGLCGIGRLHRSSRAETDPAVRTLTAECAALLGLPRVPALRRGDVPVPITWGLRRPVVLLPDAADTWPDGRLRAVLLHELAHIRRRDWAAHRLADLGCALYWFHPLVWLTARRLRGESELACDDLVLSCGVPAPDYARHLLDIARALSPAAPAAPTGAIGMARTARVEGRITQMLNPTQNRRALPRRTVFAALLAAALGVGILAALRPAAQAAPGVPLSSMLPAQAAPVSAIAPNAQSSAPVAVQIAGVGNPQKHQWWNKAGALLPKPVFDFATAENSGDTQSGLPSQPNLRRLFFALRLPPAAQDVNTTWQVSKSTFSSFTSRSGSARETEAQNYAGTAGTRVGVADFPVSVSQTDIRMGIASGPWETTAGLNRNVSAMEQFGTSTTSASDAVYMLARPVQTTKGFVFIVSVGRKSNAVRRDIRIVAVSDQGQIASTSISDNSTDSVAPLDQVTAEFSLPLSQVKSILVQTRPFRYSEFKNVALHPSQH